MTETQVPKRFLDIIDDQLSTYKNCSTVQVVNQIPNTQKIPIEKENHWLRIPDVICVFVDMIGSTKFSAQRHDNSTASAYQLFTGTAVRLFHAFDTPYIDVRGDGVFALFNKNQPYRAIVAAITFKTFIEKVFTPELKKKTKLEVGCHIGIDQKTVLVRKIGLKQYSGRSDRQNEVWAGKPINMAAKLASKTKRGELLVSDRYFNQLKDGRVLNSCGCPSGEKKTLWTTADLSDDDKFDFDTGYLLKSIWCEKHGAEYCENILKLDKE
jgi:class 3 adenylate cyclase